MASVKVNLIKSIKDFLISELVDFNSDSNVADTLTLAVRSLCHAYNLELTRVPEKESLLDIFTSIIKGAGNTKPGLVICIITFLKNDEKHIEDRSKLRASRVVQSCLKEIYLSDIAFSGVPLNLLKIFIEYRVKSIKNNLSSSTTSVTASNEVPSKKTEQKNPVDVAVMNMSREEAKELTQPTNSDINIKEGEREKTVVSIDDQGRETVIKNKEFTKPCEIAVVDVKENLSSSTNSVIASNEAPSKKKQQKRNKKNPEVITVLNMNSEETKEQKLPLDHVDDDEVIERTMEDIIVEELRSINEDLLYSIVDFLKRERVNWPEGSTNCKSLVLAVNVLNSCFGLEDREFLEEESLFDMFSSYIQAEDLNRQLNSKRVVKEDDNGESSPLMSYREVELKKDLIYAIISYLLLVVKDYSSLMTEIKIVQYCLLEIYFQTDEDYCRDTKPLLKIFAFHRLRPICSGSNEHEDEEEGAVGYSSHMGESAFNDKDLLQSMPCKLCKPGSTLTICTKNNNEVSSGSKAPKSEEKGAVGTMAMGESVFNDTDLPQNMPSKTEPTSTICSKSNNETRSRRKNNEDKEEGTVRDSIAQESAQDLPQVLKCRPGSTLTICSEGSTKKWSGSEEQEQEEEEGVVLYSWHIPESAFNDEVLPEDMPSIPSMPESSLPTCSEGNNKICPESNAHKGEGEGAVGNSLLMGESPFSDKDLTQSMPSKPRKAQRSKSNKKTRSRRKNNEDKEEGTVRDSIAQESAQDLPQVLKCRPGSTLTICSEGSTKVSSGSKAPKSEEKGAVGTTAMGESVFNDTDLPQNMPSKPSKTEPTSTICSKSNNEICSESKAHKGKGEGAVGNSSLMGERPFSDKDLTQSMPSKPRKAQRSKSNKKTRSRRKNNEDKEEGTVRDSIAQESAQDLPQVLKCRPGSTLTICSEGSTKKWSGSEEQEQEEEEGVVLYSWHIPESAFNDEVLPEDMPSIPSMPESSLPTCSEGNNKLNLLTTIAESELKKYDHEEAAASLYDFSMQKVNKPKKKPKRSILKGNAKNMEYFEVHVLENETCSGQESNESHIKETNVQSLITSQEKESLEPCVIHTGLATLEEEENEVISTLKSDIVINIIDFLTTELQNEPPDSPFIAGFISSIQFLTTKYKIEDIIALQEKYLQDISCAQVHVQENETCSGQESNESHIKETNVQSLITSQEKESLEPCVIHTCLATLEEEKNEVHVLENETCSGQESNESHIKETNVQSLITSQEKESLEPCVIHTCLATLEEEKNEVHVLENETCSGQESNESHIKETNVQSLITSQEKESLEPCVIHTGLATLEEEKNESTNKDSSVSSLNEPDLKALLEEAMAYKRPKDIQGKSDLFKELLQSVESEQKYSVMSQRPEKQGTRRPRRKQMNKKELDKTGNDGHFQDLIVHVSECDVTSNRSLKYAVKCSSGNAQVVPVNAVSVCDENNPEVAALLQNGSFDNLEQIQQFIASEANVYQIKEPVDSRVGFPLTINPYVEKTPEEGEARISVKDISTLTAPPRESTELSGKESLSDSKKSLDENGNAVGTSRMDSLAERKAKARRLKAKNDKNTILSQHIEGHRSDISEDIDALMQYIESPKSNDTKSARQRNSVGYSKHTRIGNKIAPIRDKSSDTLSRKEQKTKENQIQKSSSLEEVSISKFEDLTRSGTSEDKIKCKKSTNDKNLWKSSVTSKIEKDCRVSEGNAAPRSDKYEQELFDTDFLPVTKKNRKKRNIYDNNFRNKSNKTSDNHRSDKALGSYIRKSQELDGFHAHSREFQRRKSISSVPSSDKSGDTSDMDSVHSFPVSSSKGKGMKGNVSVSSGSTPQISYADIARSVPSPTRTELSPKCKSNIDNFGDYEDNYQFSPQESIPTVVLPLPTRKEPAESSNKLHEEYPPLENKTSEKPVSQSDMFVEYTMVFPKKKVSTPECNSENVEETVLIDMPPSKRETSASESINVAVDNRLPSKRPAVIMPKINDPKVKGLIFGFEINRQLLGSSESPEPSDVVFNEPIEDRICATNVLVDQGNSESTKQGHLETSDDPEPPVFSPQHLKLVDYVFSEWQKVQGELNDGSGRVVYFSP